MKRTITTALLILCTILMVHFLPFIPIIKYTATFIVSSLLFLFFAFELFRNDIPIKTVLILTGISILVRCTFLHTLPIGSDDIYRYMWDGKVQMNLLNPYQYAPNDQALSHLSSPIIPKLINHPEMKTMYFPLSLWLFFSGFALSGENVWGYKLLLLIFEVLCMYGSFLLLRKLHINEKYILLYALCPMLFYEYAIDAHLDGFGFPLFIFSLYFYMSERKLLGLIFLGLCLSIKPAALILLPVFFIEEKHWNGRMRIMIIPTITLAMMFFPYIVTTNPFEALFTFTQHWTFNGVIFNALNLYFNNNQTVRIICGILLLAAVILISFSKKKFSDKVYYAILSLLLFSPIVHPWYVGWLAVLLPVVRKWSGIVFVGTVSLTSFTYVYYQLNGVWGEAPTQWLAEYIPVLYFYVRELFDDSGQM